MEDSTINADLRYIINRLTAFTQTYEQEQGHKIPDIEVNMLMTQIVPILTNLQDKLPASGAIRKVNELVTDFRGKTKDDRANEIIPLMRRILVMLESLLNCQPSSLRV